MGVFVLVRADLQHTGTSECLRRKRGACALDCAIAKLVEVPRCSSARLFALSIGAGWLLLPAAGCWRAGGSHSGLWGWEGGSPLGSGELAQPLALASAFFRGLLFSELSKSVFVLFPKHWIVGWVLWTACCINLATRTELAKVFAELGVEAEVSARLLPSCTKEILLGHAGGVRVTNAFKTANYFTRRFPVCEDEQTSFSKTKKKEQKPIFYSRCFAVFKRTAVGKNWLKIELWKQLGLCIYRLEKDASWDPCLPTIHLVCVRVWLNYLVKSIHHNFSRFWKYNLIFRFVEIQS